MLVFTSCGTKEDPFTREQKEIDEYMSSEALNVYKAFKVSIRGTKAVGQDPEFDKARMQLFTLTGYFLEQASDSTPGVDNLVAMAETVAEAKPAIDELVKKDEDSLPTVMENISYAISPLDSGGNDPIASMFTESEEHLILSGLWFAGAHAHPDLSLYELNRVKADDIRDPQFRCLAEMVRSLLYLTHEWPYHAEKSADDFLAMTESEKEALIASPWPAVDAHGNPVTPEQSWHQMRAIGFVLRATAREKCEEEEKKDLALEDYESFISEAQAGGMDHELVDMVGLMVALKKEDNAKALEHIASLEKRTNLTQEEKDVIAEIKTYVENDQRDKAQEAIDENGYLPGFASGLFSDQFMNLPMIKKLQASDAGKKFISITEIKADELVPTDAIDSLKKDAEGLIEKVL